MNKKECLEQALKICTGSREVAYGKPENNFANIAELWNAYFSRRNATEITPTDVAILMILMKVGRLIGNPKHLDSWVDICGYAANGAEICDK